MRRNDLAVTRCFSIGEVGEAAWRPLEPHDFPFFDYEFLAALENSRSVGGRSGWVPVYLLCYEQGDDTPVGAMCVYLRSDSYGEYIFDWDWAHAYQQNGMPYYPKLTSAVPFTPATGGKFLIPPSTDPVLRGQIIDALMDAVRDLGEELNVSSSHALFVPESEVTEFEKRGFAIRHSMQFHWRNGNYETFDDYIGAMQSKRRRQISRERRQLQDENLSIERITGSRLDESHAAAMYDFYISTADRKWGSPYLTEDFFHEVFRTMGDRLLFVLARDDEGYPIAGTLNFFKGDALFGRYWGAVEDRRNLHFELCYYQAIEFAIERGMQLFEAGAQGEHKLARGFLPSITYSAHDIVHPAFRRAIENYIAEEREVMRYNLAAYREHDPFKTSG